ncbi:major facilitator superfamily domain-containing protein [Triangularia verruculosa]|uniref:Major facilitator superfamily domain-containing protein n=1 Tax=Triangularia verruculosa TaxID=2587418 RepID=A0AAN6XP15_9PEZI|nr:major facilitator superfamily domain-containing protein [Triangularia verruculosa]
MSSSRPPQPAASTLPNNSLNVLSPAPIENETTPLLPKPPSAASSSSQAVSGAGTETEEAVLIAQPLSPARLYITLASSYLGVFLGAVDASIIVTLSGPIASEFHSLSLLSWLAASYLIANAACQPLSGRLTDIFGRGPGLVFSNLMFGLGNLLCGLAKNEQQIILGRVIAGVGGGGLMSISTFLATDLVPLKKRGVVQGLGNIAYGTGAMLGGVFGGFINDTSSWGWRLAFLIQVPIIAVSGGLVAYLVRVPPKVSNKSLISRIDFLGAFFIVGFLVLTLLGLNAGGNLVKWTDPLVLTSIPLGVSMLFALIWWEGRVEQPIIPVKLLVERTVAAACITNFCSSMVMMMTMFYVPLYLQVLGYTPTQSAYRILSSSVGVSFASVGSGWIMKKTGKYVGLGRIVLSVYTVAVALNTLLDQHTPTWIPFVSMTLHGAGYGAMLTVTLLGCIAAVEHSQQAPVTSATYAFRSVGTTLGITVASAVYQNILKAKLWEKFGDLPGAAEEIGRIRDDLGELGRLPEGWYDGVIASFMEAFKGVWFTALGLTVISLISISFMKQHRLHSTLTRQEE